MIGSGRQARTQLEALNGVHELAQVRVYSRNPANVEAYVKTMSERVDAELVACTSAAEAVRGADIVVTATTAAGPVLMADDLEPGMHVVAMEATTRCMAKWSRRQWHVRIVCSWTTWMGRTWRPET